MKRVIGIVSIAAVLAGCAGVGTGSPLPTTRGTSSRGTASFKVKIPAPNSNARTPMYVSPGTQSVSFSITGTSYAELMQVTESSPGCSKDQLGNLICVLDANVPVGNNQMLVVKTFATADGTGTPLSTNNIVINVVSGQSNPVNITLNGIVTSVDYWTTGTFTKGASGSVQFQWDGKDAAGYWIAGSEYDINGNAVKTGSFHVDDSTDFTWRNDSSGNLFLDYNGANVADPTVTLDVNSGEFTASHVITLTTL